MNKELKNLNVDIKSLIAVFIIFFYGTGCKYSCTRTKIGKLLSILAFKYALNGEKLFNETIYKYDNCGTILKATQNLLCREEYICWHHQDDKIYISKGFQNNITIPPRFKDIILPDSDIVLEIEDVFRNFGAYSAVDLGNFLNPIVDIATTISYGEIELTKIKDIIEQLDESNEIVKYLKESKFNKAYQKTK